MSYFYSVRGWIECNFEAMESIRKIIDETYKEYDNGIPSDYWKGWKTDTHKFNWTAYVFYGLDVQIRGVELFEKAIESISKVRGIIYGYFRITGEDQATDYKLELHEDGYEREDLTK